MRHGLLFTREPSTTSLAMGPLVLAIAAAMLTWILLNGTNPIHLTAQAG